MTPEAPRSAPQQAPRPYPDDSVLKELVHLELAPAAWFVEFDGNTAVRLIVSGLTQGQQRFVVDHYMVRHKFETVEEGLLGAPVAVTNRRQAFNVAQEVFMRWINHKFRTPKP